ncbi:MAG: UDP-N-acetylglucosamine 2-epimerase [candidate division TA06 bacterium 32_111]|uniref:UDP-N-acetylglucosamine 2-epimerase n=2 Tax=Bacteria candidate phyla TaxID=1783234 RepID=A0A101I3C1_UNCT6|nr:MAG: UDP-N-acetylglucosamine 2-epimerase [candidate division TA06 bacterium 32_111]KUK88006.1 MAG: UDP-N-acetylglucosamine 2-epimerase [candidate division TA06 bacterium 34_109]HAF06934.1 UDP-N-acetylglucosamine 2-epimerase (non-hydrolyzing) [candidate division WOR-3 bacterium]HCP16848.1 UDP-N-acetylglucosamine 2-epimerase (non-hydrolyzing) [candidate division WOR-3 bacterium]
MKKLKVMTILGTRPEIIRLSEVIKANDKYFNHILVHTGQNWDYNLYQIFFKELGLRKPDYFLNSVGKNLGETMGNIIKKSYEVLLKEKPDAVLILGDTNSTLSAISAKRLKIPIFHMEAGNRCFDQNVPEELNRRIVDHISDINLPYTEHSRRYLIQEGIRKDYIFVTGSPMTEVLLKNFDKISKSKIIENLKLKKNNYIILSSHREENLDIDDNLTPLVEAINCVADTFKMPIIYSVHPRSEKKIKDKKIKFNKLVKKLKPFGFIDYNNLQMNSYCVLSDSGTLSEESAILGFPAVLIRTSTERPEVLDKGTIVIGGIEKENIVNSIKIAKETFENRDKNQIPFDYFDKDVSIKVVKIIQSYTRIVDKFVWMKKI